MVCRCCSTAGQWDSPAQRTQKLPALLDPWTWKSQKGVSATVGGYRDSPGTGGGWAGLRPDCSSDRGSMLVQEGESCGGCPWRWCKELTLPWVFFGTASQIHWKLCLTLCFWDNNLRQPDLVLALLFMLLVCNPNFRRHMFLFKKMILAWNTSSKVESLPWTHEQSQVT